jgi:hypothetical protein
MQVEHGREVEPAFAGCDGSHVGHPCAVGLGHAERASKQVGRDRAAVLRVGRPLSGSSVSVIANALRLRRVEIYRPCDGPSHTKRIMIARPLIRGHESVFITDDQEAELLSG